MSSKAHTEKAFKAKLIEENIGVFAMLLKSGTDITAMREQFEEMREGVAKITEGCTGSTQFDIQIWNKICLNIDRAIPLFVRSNLRKEQWEKREGFVPPHAETHIQKVNRAIHSGWIAPLRAVAHYLLIAYLRQKYEDVTDLEFEKAKVGAEAVAQILERQGEMLNGVENEP